MRSKNYRKDVALPDINFMDGSIEHVIDLVSQFEEKHNLIKEAHLTRDSSGVKIVATDTDGYKYIITRTDPEK